jgi:hypothetical protein
VGVETLNSAWTTFDDAKDTLLVIWVETAAHCGVKISPTVSHVSMLVIVRTYRANAWLPPVFVVHSHVYVHKEFHAGPKASGVCGTTHNKELIAPRKEYWQALEVCLDIPLINANFVEPYLRWASVGRCKATGPLT